MFFFWSLTCFRPLCQAISLAYRFWRSIKHNEANMARPQVTSHQRIHLFATSCPWWVFNIAHVEHSLRLRYNLNNWWFPNGTPSVWLDQGTLIINWTLYCRNRQELLAKLCPCCNWEHWAGFSRLPLLGIALIKRHMGMFQCYCTPQNRSFGTIFDYKKWYHIV